MSNQHHFFGFIEPEPPSPEVPEHLLKFINPVDDLHGSSPALKPCVCGTTLAIDRPAKGPHLLRLTCLPCDINNKWLGRLHAERLASEVDR